VVNRHATAGHRTATSPPGERAHHPFQEQLSGLRLIVRKAVVGEEVLLAGTDEQLGVRRGGDQLAGGVESPSPAKRSSPSMPCTCTGTPAGQLPNSATGRQE
jgi:hypothetical protein